MTVYALKHPDGRWLYHLPKPEAFGTPGFGSTAKVTGVFADGQPMEQLHADWWATDHEAGRLAATAQPPAKTTGYRLTDSSAESVRYPATLTLEEWAERSDREGDALWQLYTNVREDQPALEHVYDGPVMVLEGREPPRPDEPQWVAQLPHMLTQRPEYRHLFPGHIPGLRKHLYEVIKAMPGVKYCFDGYQGKVGLHITVEVPFDQPVTRWQADISRRTSKPLKSGRTSKPLKSGRTSKPLKSGRTVRVYVSRSLDLPVPADVLADTYEQALQEWDWQIAFWLSVVTDAKVVACSACHGTGHVSEGSEKHSTSR
ncbi:hypothetical protein [Streptomyces sp. NPDC005407]|uniref:hypothetical protein n=1 Tax=Streptomyces sp. NPDC005407 TaxID=3155340 RepID=UPI00339E8EBD